MEQSGSTVARRLAHAAVEFEHQRTGHAPESVTVVLSRETLVITLRGALSPAERAMAKDPAGAAKLQEYHTELFANASDPLRKEIKRITGVDVREASTEAEPKDGRVVGVFKAGTTVQVFLLSQNVPADSWSGRPDVGNVKSDDKTSFPRLAGHEPTEMKLDGE